MRTGTTRLIATLAFFTLPAPAQAPERPTVLRVTTRLVEVSVIVHDKKGQPVGGLSRDDFELLDQGKPQQIHFFSEQSNRTPPAARKPLPANMFSNRPEYRYDVPTSVTVVLFDWLNAQFEDAAYARRQVVHFLEQVQPNDRVGIYALVDTGHLRVIHDFSSDAEELVRALQLFTGSIPRQLIPPERRAQVAAARGDAARVAGELENWLSESGREPARTDLENRVQETMTAIESIAHYLQRIPGRKNLIWVSSAFPSLIEWQERLRGGRVEFPLTFSYEINRATRALNDANVAIYPVDARGLVGNPAFTAAQQQPPFDSIAPELPWDSNLDNMKRVAELTGGRAFYDSNDIEGAMRGAISDSQVTYTLGYYPAHNKWDGRFHEIKVKVSRPGVTVRCRRGYFATPEAVADHDQIQRELFDAVWSPLDSTGLGVVVRVRRGQPGVLKLTLRLNAREVRFEQKDGRWMATLDVLTLQKNAAGLEVATSSQTAALKLRGETHDRALKWGLYLTKTVRLADGPGELRVVIRDRQSGSLGSVSISPLPGH